MWKMMAWEGSTKSHREARRFGGGGGRATIGRLELPPGERRFVDPPLRGGGGGG